MAMKVRRLGFVLSAAALAASVGGASVRANAATGTPRFQQLAKTQTRLYAALDNNTGVSPPRCGQGQPLKGVRGVFLLPVFASTDAPERKTLECTTSAHKVLVDAGGFAVTEDNNGPSWPLPSPDGGLVPFSRPHLDAICDDVVANFLPDNGISPAVVTVDGETQQPVAVATRWFLAPHSPTLETQYADSIALGHPGLLATDFCGYKALAHLRPGRHAVTVDYSLIAGTPGTVYTYKINVI
jgi:hypothetical protein